MMQWEMTKQEMTRELRTTYRRPKTLRVLQSHVKMYNQLKGDQRIGDKSCYSVSLGKIKATLVTGRL